MSEYMPEASMEGVKKGWAYLKEYNAKYKPHTGVTPGNAKRCVGINKEGRFCVFRSISEAAKRLNLDSSEISKCCKKKRKTVGGLRWYYEEDDAWLSGVKQ